MFGGGSNKSSCFCYRIDNNNKYFIGAMNKNEKIYIRSSIQCLQDYHEKYLTIKLKVDCFVKE